MNSSYCLCGIVRRISCGIGDLIGASRCCVYGTCCRNTHNPINCIKCGSSLINVGWSLRNGDWISAGDSDDRRSDISECRANSVWTLNIRESIRGNSSLINPVNKNSHNGVPRRCCYEELLITCLSKRNKSWRWNRTPLARRRKYCKRRKNCCCTNTSIPRSSPDTGSCCRFGIQSYRIPWNQMNVSKDMRSFS